MDDNEIRIRLLLPDRLYSRDEVLGPACPVPRAAGVYAWFFRQVPDVVPTEGCLTHEGMTLLYVGISPDKQGKPKSSQTLRHRVRYHYQGNAEGSTLRRTLGVLLAKESGFPLRRVGSGRRMTFTNAGERWLDGWMRENALVTWVEHGEPWLLEHELLHAVSLPLNLKGNGHHAFAATLSGLRRRANAQARELPIVDDRNPR
jgi:hypothetical protein